MTQSTVFTYFPSLRTKRCILNHIEDSDITNIYSLLRDKDVIRYVEAIASPLSLDETKDFISLFETSYYNCRAILWAIRIDSAPENLIGLIAIYQIAEGASAELLYLLSPQYWNQGYMKECLKRVTQFCFDDMDIEIVKLSINKYNKNSMVLAEGCGYTVKERIGDEVTFEILTS